MSGRIAAIDAVDENGKVTVFVGSASGGVWKSINGATTFRPVFDKQDIQSIGAITIDPVGATYWRGYPFRELARYVDVFLPMTYFTARTSGAGHVASYSAANVRSLRALAGNAAFPVHPIGGDARSATLPELRAFLHAAATSRTLGASLWEYGETSRAQWSALGAA